MLTASSGSRTQDQVDLLLVRLADVTIAIDATCVSAFLDVPSDARIVWSLAKFLGLPEGEPRIIAVLKGRTGSVQVYLGQQYSLKRIPLKRIAPVPEFVSGIRSRYGIAGLFELDGRIAYLIDVESLIRAVGLERTRTE